MPPLLYISYAAQDQRFLVRLCTHLVPLQQEGLIEIWHRGMIRCSQVERDECDAQLRRARIHLLLVSADLICVRSAEIDDAMRQVVRGAVLIPLRIRPCNLGPTPFGGMTQLPRNGKPISQWTHAEEAWTEVVQEIRNELARPSSRAPRGANGQHLRTLGPTVSLSLTVLLLLAFCLPQSVRVDRLAAKKELPRYTADISGDASFRGSVAAPQQRIRVSRDSTLDVKLRPEYRVTEDVEATVLIKAKDGSARKWPVKFDRVDGGMLRTRGRVRDLPDMARPGAFEMLIWIHRHEESCSPEGSDWIHLELEITAEPIEGSRSFAPVPVD